LVIFAAVTAGCGSSPGPGDDLPQDSAQSSDTGTGQPGADPTGAEPDAGESTDGEGTATGGPPTRGGKPGTPTEGKKPGALGSPIKFNPTQQNPTLAERREHFRDELRRECGADLCDVTFNVIYHDVPDFAGEACSVKDTDWPEPPHRGMVITIEVYNPCSENKDGPKITTSTTTVTTAAERTTTTTQDTAQAPEQPAAPERAIVPPTSLDGG
jgi:hypothetical protein